MTKKLNPAEIDIIKQHREEGYKLAEIASIFNISKNAVRYHCNENYKNYIIERNRERYRNMSPQEKKELFKKRKNYQREYHRKYRELKGGKKENDI